MRAVILGGSGFIGTTLSNLMLDRGWQVVIPSRSPEKGRFLIPKGHSFDVSFVPWDGNDPTQLAKYFTGADAIINLSGENIAASRWTEQHKERIRTSRIQTGISVIKAFQLVESLPEVLVQGSAVGYYGGCDHMESAVAFSESSPAGEGFLASVAQEWEESTAKAEQLGVRRVIIRSGVVLGPEGGALQKFLPPFRMFAGGPIGSGNQGFSWIHKHDAAAGIIHLIENKTCSGPFNLTSPAPVSMSDFCRILGKTLNRPSWLPVPAFALRMLLGEMAEEMLLQGQYALPERLCSTGYTFTYPDLTDALHNILTQ